jgi:hypothetical protein
MVPRLDKKCNKNNGLAGLRDFRECFTVTRNAMIRERARIHSRSTARGAICCRASSADPGRGMARSVLRVPSSRPRLSSMDCCVPNYHASEIRGSFSVDHGRPITERASPCRVQTVIAVRLPHDERCYWSTSRSGQE